MKRKLLAIIALTLALAIGGCTASQPTPTTPPPNPPPADIYEYDEYDDEDLPEIVIELPHHNAKNSLDWAGIYQGVLPSESGAGIRVEMSLLGDVYSLSFEHLEEGAQLPEITDASWPEWAQRVGHQSGTFEWTESGNIIRLDVNEFPPYFWVSENRVIHLGMFDQLPTAFSQLDEAYALTRVMPGPTPPAPSDNDAATPGCCPPQPNTIHATPQPQQQQALPNDGAIWLTCPLGSQTFVSTAGDATEGQMQAPNPNAPPLEECIESFNHLFELGLIDEHGNFTDAMLDVPGSDMFAMCQETLDFLYEMGYIDQPQQSQRPSTPGAGR